jgi:hypothetical protein
MVKVFLSHGLKKSWRSVSASRELATTLLLTFFAIMLSGYILALGFYLDDIIINGLGQADAFGFLSKLLIYYFLFDFMFRYLMQNVPILEIRPYLHLPVKRFMIIHFLLGKSVFHVFNAFVLLLFSPFAFSVVAVQSGGFAAVSWLASLWFISVAIHYVVILYKVKLDDTFRGVAGLIAVITLLAISDYNQWFKLSDVSAVVFGNAINGFLFPVASFSLLCMTYIINYKVFLQSIYPEEVAPDKVSRFGQRAEFGFLKQFGSLGDWIALEIKLILRNKRPRTILFLSTLFLLYGLIFYDEPKYTEEMPGVLLFVGTFVTGIFMINYGQYLYSWQAVHFDFTVTRPVSMKQFVEAKYWLLGTVTILCFLLTIPYVFFGWKILMINTVMLLFNLGVNIFVIMNVGMWSPKRLDLTKGGAFNIQGVGAAQWIMGIPIFIGPYFFYLPFSLAGFPMVGIFAVGLAGLVGILFRPYLIRVTSNRLLEKKHQIAAGFRKE